MECLRESISPCDPRGKLGHTAKLSAWMVDASFRLWRPTHHVTQYMLQVDWNMHQRYQKRIEKARRRGYHSCRQRPVVTYSARSAPKGDRDGGIGRFAIDCGVGFFQQLLTQIALTIDDNGPRKQGSSYLEPT